MEPPSQKLPPPRAAERHAERQEHAHAHDHADAYGHAAKAHPDTSPSILAYLEEALTELGWIDDLQRCLSIAETEDYPDPLMDLLMEKTGATASEVSEMMRPQCGPLADRLRQKMAEIEEEERRKADEERKLREQEEEAKRIADETRRREAEAELQRLREAERVRQAEALRRMRSYCPYCGLTNCGWTDVRVVEFF